MHFGASPLGGTERIAGIDDERKRADLRACPFSSKFLLVFYTQLCIIILMKTAFFRHFAQRLTVFPGRRSQGSRASDRFHSKGRRPDDWKPMPSIGDGVREIRIREASGAFRVLYVACSEIQRSCLCPACFSKEVTKDEQGRY
jgi:phage-related protein